MSYIPSISIFHKTMQAELNWYQCCVGIFYLRKNNKIKRIFLYNLLFYVFNIPHLKNHQPLITILNHLLFSLKSVCLIIAC